MNYNINNLPIKTIVASILFATFAIADQNLTQSVNNLETKIKDCNITAKTFDVNLSGIDEAKIEQAQNNLKPLIEEYKSNILYDGNNIAFGKPEQAKAQGFGADNNQKRGEKQPPKDWKIPTDRIYIFMSSSVPTTIWNNYAEYVDEFKLHNATLLLRGCIGGCEKIKPTLEFISKIVTQEGKNKEGLKARIQIDPLLFKKYGISEAPCFVYAQNVNPNSFELSEGLDTNLKGEIKSFKSCGDWSFQYHIEELAKMSESKELGEVLKRISRK